MRVYVETGILIDYLTQAPFDTLRPAQRRGRSPQQLYDDAVEALSLISSFFTGAVSAFSFNEAEEAFYALVSRAIKNVPNVATIRLASTRPILVQALFAVRLFDLEILSLTERAVDLVANSSVFADEGMRVADALHLTMAAGFDADVVLSTDRRILRLDARIPNRSDRAMRCCDTDRGLMLLRNASG